MNCPLASFVLISNVALTCNEPPAVLDFVTVILPVPLELLPADQKHPPSGSPNVRAPIPASVNSFFELLLNSQITIAITEVLSALWRLTPANNAAVLVEH